MKNKYLIWGAVAVGAYLIWKRMSKSTDNGKELAPPPVPVEKPLPPRERPQSKPPVNILNKKNEKKLNFSSCRYNCNRWYRLRILSKHQERKRSQRR